MDARQIEDGAQLQTDVLVIGGGAAGLALSTALHSAGIDVLLAEAGGEAAQPGPFSDGFSQAGPHTFDISGRRRAVGGGMTEWGGNCALAQPEDFQPRSVRDADGNSEDLLDWPIDPEELRAYTGDVEAILRLPSGALGAAAMAREPIGFLGAHAGSFRTRRYLRADTDAGLIAMRRQLRQADNKARLLTDALHRPAWCGHVGSRGRCAAGVTRQSRGDRDCPSGRAVRRAG